MEIENVFITMLKENLDDLRSGKLLKNKFLGKYMDALNKVDRANAFRFKRPQVIGEGKEPTNNWLDYVINMPEEEFVYFKSAL